MTRQEIYVDQKKKTNRDSQKKKKKWSVAEEVLWYGAAFLGNVSVWYL